MVLRPFSPYRVSEIPVDFPKARCSGRISSRRSTLYSFPLRPYAGNDWSFQFMTDPMNDWCVKCMLARPLGLLQRALYSLNGKPSGGCRTCIATGIVLACSRWGGAAQSGAITSTNYNPVGRQAAAKISRFEAHRVPLRDGSARLVCKAKPLAPASSEFDKDGLKPRSLKSPRTPMNTSTGGN